MPTLSISSTAQATLLSNALHNSICGAIIGSALGDAIGIYTEFLTAEKAAQSYPREPSTSYLPSSSPSTSLTSLPPTRVFTLHPPQNATPFRRDRHRSPLKPGSWTDDTDHATLILLSFLRENDVRPLDIAGRLRIWATSGFRPLDKLPFGMGATMGTIIRTASFLEDPEGTAWTVWCKSERNAAPNGSLMRTHTLGLICVGKSAEETFAAAAEVSVITHVDPRCVLSCAIGTDLVRGVAIGEYTSEEDIDSAVRAAVEWYPNWARGRRPEDEEYSTLDLTDLKRHVEATSLSELKLDDKAAMGYVYKCLGSGILLLRQAIRVLQQSTSLLATKPLLFEALITELVMQAGDADTNATFAGSLLGAYLGYANLPAHWRDGLRNGDWLLGKADSLCRSLGVLPGGYDVECDPDTLPDGGRGLLTQGEMEGRVMELQARMAQEEREWRVKEEEEEKRKNRLSLRNLRWGRKE